MQEGIPAGKKRISITLQETTINRMHSYLGRNHQPKSMMSLIIDEQLTTVLDSIDSFERMQKEKGRELSVGDMFSVIGSELTKLDSKQGKLL